MSKRANPERSYQGNPEAMKWPTDKPKYDKNYLKILGTTCKDCNFYEKDHVNDDGDWVRGWGCCCPIKCPYGKEKEQQNDREIQNRG